MSPAAIVEQQQRQQNGSAEGAPGHGTVAHLLPPGAKQRMVAGWLEEDTPSFDYGGFVVGEGPAEARLMGKSEGVLAGVPFFDEVFRQLDCTVEWLYPEGTRVTLDSSSKKLHLATVRGPTRHLLLGERPALNALARCSGIATATARLLSLMRAAGYKGALAGTRKTTPGFRLVEKYGMLVGGADPHRHDLSSMVMLKDNHIWATGGSISRGVKAARSAAGFAVKVEVECGSFEEADEAAGAGADVVMLDNFEPADARNCALKLRGKYGPKLLVEVSGGLTEDNVRDFVVGGDGDVGATDTAVEAQVDVVSTSAIHQGVKHVDFSLKVVPKENPPST